MTKQIKSEPKVEVGEKVGEHLMGLVTGGSSSNLAIDFKSDFNSGSHYLKATWRRSF